MLFECLLVCDYFPFSMIHEAVYMLSDYYCIFIAGIFITV